MYFKRYNYSRDDEEVYKEFLEIAHELIVHVVKIASEGALLGSTHRAAVEFAAQSRAARDHAGDEREHHMTLTPFLKDVDNYLSLLRFYDGLCKWEEGSQLPVLHVTWAKHFAFCVLKFDKSVRAQLDAELENASESGVSDAESDLKSSPSSFKSSSPSTKMSQLDVQSNGSDEKPLQTSPGAGKNTEKEESPSTGREDREDSSPISAERSKEEQAGSDVTSKRQQVSRKSSSEGEAEGDQSIEDIAKQCSSEILNPDFLLGKGKPFAAKASSLSPASAKSSSSGGPCDVGDMPPVKRSRCSPVFSGKLRFRSAKMQGMRSLLTSERLNVGAITLQLTAQSQVSLKQSKGSKASKTSTRRRSRRSEAGPSG